jgi:hypothetical protein
MYFKKLRPIIRRKKKKLRPINKKTNTFTHIKKEKTKQKRKVAEERKQIDT